MTDTALTPDVNGNLSDEKIDKFFESQGKEDIGTDTEVSDQENNNNVQEEQQSDASVSEPSKEKEVDKNDKQSELDRNYKAAMQEERERRKELQRQLDEQRNRTAQLEATFQRVVEKVNQPQQQPQVPDFNADPIEALRYNQEQLQKAYIQQHQIQEQRQHVEAQQQVFNQFLGKYQQSATEFSQQTTDFKDAYKFLHDERVKEYKEAGFDHAQAERLFIDDELAVASKAFQDGVNPASRIYNIAKARGYQQKSAQATTQQNNQQKMDALQKGVQASKSLSGVGGKADNPMTLEALAQMNNDELDDYLNDKNWGKILKMG